MPRIVFVGGTGFGRGARAPGLAAGSGVRRGPSVCGADSLCGRRGARAPELAAGSVRNLKYSGNTKSSD